ncbi:MAG: hypothetical protein JHC87_03085 [Thermoleophilaceae bacterium]|nr:hypothetical protein [Thermoleophilaceae bacterium]
MSDKDFPDEEFDAGKARAKNGSAEGRGKADRDVDDIELEWEELDWDDLGFEPEDGDRVREAWQRLNRGYDRSGGGAGAGLLRLIEIFGDAASEAVSPQTKRQLEHLVREFLIVLRDVIDRVIDNLEEEPEIEIEEIPID